MNDHELIYTLAVKNGRAKQGGKHTLFIFPNLRTARMAALTMARDPDLFPSGGFTFWAASTIGADQPFTKSKGTMLSRIYERLTKASRRRAIDTEFDQTIEAWYRQGVYDAFKALQDELT